MVARPKQIILLAVGALACVNAAVAKDPDWKRRGRPARRLVSLGRGNVDLRHILANQAATGSWPKNIDTTKLQTGKKDEHGTFDNGATVGEIRFLVRAYRVTAKPEYRDAVIKAVDHILVRSIRPAAGRSSFRRVSSISPHHVQRRCNERQPVLELAARGVNLGSSLRVLRIAARRPPRRSMPELLASSNLRSSWTAKRRSGVRSMTRSRSSLVREPSSRSRCDARRRGDSTLLMSLDHPSPPVITAVEAGARWFEEVKLQGIRQVVENGDKRIVADPNAPPLWVRFSEIGTNRPLFCGRDSVVKYDLAAIEPERRNGYAWYGTWGDALAKRYARWKSNRSKPRFWHSDRRKVKSQNEIRWMNEEVAECWARFPRTFFLLALLSTSSFDSWWSFFLDRLKSLRIRAGIDHLATCDPHDPPSGVVRSAISG